MEVVELISTRERQGSSSNKPGTKAEAELNQTMDQSKSNTPEIQSNKSKDQNSQKPADRSSKTTSQIQQRGLPAKYSLVHKQQRAAAQG